MASNGNGNNMLIVKMTHGKDIRRFTQGDANALKWGAIQKRATECFDLPARKFKVTYVDDEGDKVTISSDEELLEAVGLALSCTPAVLRLTVHAAKNAEGEGNKPTEVPAPAAPPPGNKEFADFVETMAKQLPTLASQIPAMANQIPESLRQLLPHTELDLAATIAANAPGDGFVNPHKTDATPGVHEGVTCDKSGVCPIVGNRYHLIGHNYDLCEAEYNKLEDKEKAAFKKIAPPGVEADEPVGFHPGVSCDRSGMVPIVGTRFNLRGHNYDLCQAEFDKLPDAEKALYDAIAPPVDVKVNDAAGGAWRGGHGWGRGGWGRGWGGAFGKGMGGAFGKGMGGKGMGCGKGMGGNQLSARFICDVAVFDGTQMAPGTKFTKIWRIKNSGEMAWPPGTRMLFVGGDQMTTEMSVPIGRDLPVMPGEEVDVAVEMTAPTDLGRYLGYWRLTGPHGRRKWGQRVWCHVQVVDPSQPDSAVDVESAVAEFEKMKSKLPDEGEDDGADETTEEVAAAAAATSMASTSMASTSDASTSTNFPAAMVDEPASAAAPVATPPIAPPTAAPTAAPATVSGEPMALGDDSDDGVLVTDTMVVEAQPAADVAPEALSGVDLVKTSLKAMGFLDDTMIDAVVSKHGEDVDACATDLAAATEWDSLLDDLTEMGFENRELNKTLMLKNNGNIKRTVKDLVEA